MDDLTKSQKIIEQKKMIFGWRDCYLRLKRILANKYVNGGLVESESSVSPFTVLVPVIKDKIAEQLKELKESYEEGLKSIQEKWI